MSATADPGMSMCQVKQYVTQKSGGEDQIEKKDNMALYLRAQSNGAEPDYLKDQEAPSGPSLPSIRGTIVPADVMDL
jgi:hypothetical protein